ncbi:histidine kinase [Nocardia sp. NPDC127579]|uniref:histidine kinase n=1 Tax=Nocardia sp. NPDC127579 TaxID=3345402 RepID=UPI0036354401
MGSGRARQWWIDGALAAVLLAAELVAAHLIPNVRELDRFGTALLVLGTVPLAARTYAPLPVLAAHLTLAIPYHANEFPHEAIVPATIVALYTAARYGNRRRTAIMVVAVLCFGLGGILLSGEGNENIALEAFGAIGWIVLACVAGEAVRLHRAYIAEVLDRAERAERTRDEEARRQVTEERLRIARDLHDLLAHTITVIQVQAGVAAHLLTERRADPDTVLGALDTITGACADARAELSATVGVLRAPPGESRGALPSLAQLPALITLAESSGLRVLFESIGQVRTLVPTVEMVGYRIIQEALTNVAKHADATEVTLVLDYRPNQLLVTVADNGRGIECGAPGFGVRGMIERAEAIGGYAFAQNSAAGFVVTAALPAEPGRPEPSGAQNSGNGFVVTATLPAEPRHADGSQPRTVAGDHGRGRGGPPETDRTGLTETARPEPTETGRAGQTETDRTEPTETGRPEPTETGRTEPTETGRPEPTETGQAEPAAAERAWAIGAGVVPGTVQPLSSSELQAGTA